MSSFDTPAAAKIEAPEEKLAKLVETATGVLLDKGKLKAFVVSHWRALQTYAHAIHDEDVAARAIEIYQINQGNQSKYGRQPSSCDRS